MMMVEKKFRAAVDSGNLSSAFFFKPFERFQKITVRNLLSEVKHIFGVIYEKHPCSWVVHIILYCFLAGISL